MNIKLVNKLFQQTEIKTNNSQLVRNLWWETLNH